ncbi:hypothetical protein [Phreatobacter cathodiphilus]|uniref:Peptidase inhibitor family I36 n=1 Tax=Phreatobacter cathodiphilus TaxID=1868589 RepID=A0A2S0NGB5_9HYPH|nr:hypothetical protein [Phreatobacter cathodiphilus]AVO47107.1 hypothetical protein C6569_19770 [Phreatobacter cathodiphilus]
MPICIPTMSARALRRSGSTGFALLLLASAAASAQSIDMRREYYEGRWTWHGVYRAMNDPNNVSRIQFNTPTRATYCYQRHCWNVNVRRDAGASLSFSTDRKNYFEFNPGGDPVRLPARFWVNFQPPARSPDATIVFGRRN